MVNAGGKLIAALAFALYFVYPIPHTIALRNLILAALLGVSLFCLARGPRRPGAIDWSVFRTPAGLLVALTLWLLLQSTLISPRSAEALEMFRGDWLVALSVMFVALLSAATTPKPPFDHVRSAITLSLLIHIIAMLLYQVAIWVAVGQFPFGATPFAERDYHSMLATILAALALAELLARLPTKCHDKSHSLRLPIISLSLACIATLTLASRNATLIVAVLLLVGGFVFCARTQLSGKGKAITALSVALLLSFGAWLGFETDARWAGFTEAASIAIDTDKHLTWLDTKKYPKPTTSSGKPIEESAYLRLAWAKVGAEQIAHYPLGLGYGHKAFGWAIERSYHVQTDHESSHSGLIDFTLANGIPGLVLWLALSASLAMAGWRGFRQYGSPAGLALTLSVIAYLVRCLLDGHLSGFRLEMYAFVVGVLIMRQLQESARCD